MAKSVLHLSVDTEVIEIAKAKGINLSNAFENYIKDMIDIDIQKEVNDNATPEKELEKAILKVETLKRQISMQEEMIAKSEENKKKDDYDRIEIDGILNQIVNNIIKNNRYQDNQWEENIRGFQNILKRRLNRFIEAYQIKEWINNKIKEKLDDNQRKS